MQGTTSCKRLNLDIDLILDPFCMDFTALPEEIIRLIFAYFTDADVYLKLRDVNCQVRQCVDNYLRLGKPMLVKIIKK